MASSSKTATSSRTEVRSPTRTSTWANTRGNFTATVTGGAGKGATSVVINTPKQNPSAKRGKYIWAVRQTGAKSGRPSLGGVRADNYKAALKRAHEIGFKNPDSVALDVDGRIMKAWRKSAGYK